MKKRSHKQALTNYIIFLAALLALAWLTVTSAGAQRNQWSPQQPIPGFHPETEPPVLVADQDRTVHAFSSQWFGEDSGDPQVEVFYNQWTLDGGWTAPTDILMSPLLKEAWIMSAYLDKHGVMHVVFFGGQDLGANIYYTRAPALEAGRASAWSEPLLVGEDAKTPKNVAFSADDDGDFVILYGGDRDGNGVYAVYSRDGGDSWSDPVPIFVTNSDDLLTFGLRLYLDRSGWLQATWNTVTLGGQGRAIYYSRSRFDTKEWSDPVELVETSSGYGAWSPALIEHGGELFVLYIVGPKIVMRRSSDHGQTWTEPVMPFPRHVGVNGTLSLVVDGNVRLHLFFGQRITGNPDIHGMWHSVWSDARWTEPESVVSGPQINDLEGDKAFDPYDARAIVSQGNVILVTWRSDPGNKGNGVWYSYRVLNSPEMPVSLLPTYQPAEAPVSTTAISVPTQLAFHSLDTRSNANPITESLNTDVKTSNNPITPLITGILPAILLISGAIITKRVFHH